MSKFGPSAHLASAIIDWPPYYEKAMGDAMSGKWTSGATWWGVKEGAIDVVSLSPKISPELRQKLDSVKAGLKSGTFTIWKGPISDQSGKEVLKASEVADDKFLHGIGFYVKGVEGTLPSSK